MNEQATTRAQVERVYIEVMTDQDGDPSWLTQTPAELGSLGAGAVWNRRRLKALQAGEWGFVGVRVRAEISVYDTGRGTILNTVQADSAGLWGIESDSGEDYFRSTAEDEWGELVDTLAALGLTYDFDAATAEIVYR